MTIAVASDGRRRTFLIMELIFWLWTQLSPRTSPVTQNSKSSPRTKELSSKKQLQSPKKKWFRIPIIIVERNLYLQGKCWTCMSGRKISQWIWLWIWQMDGRKIINLFRKQEFNNSHPWSVRLLEYDIFPWLYYLIKTLNYLYSQSKMNAP